MQNYTNLYKIDIRPAIILFFSDIGTYSIFSYGCIHLFPNQLQLYGVLRLFFWAGGVWLLECRQGFCGCYDCKLLCTGSPCPLCLAIWWVSWLLPIARASWDHESCRLVSHQTSKMLVQTSKVRVQTSKIQVQTPKIQEKSKMQIQTPTI